MSLIIYTTSKNKQNLLPIDNKGNGYNYTVQAIGLGNKIGKY